MEASYNRKKSQSWEEGIVESEIEEGLLPGVERVSARFAEEGYGVTR